MSVSERLNEILRLQRQIHEEIGDLATRPLAPTQIIIVNGLSDIAESLGIINAGEFRAGNNKEPGSGFSGVRMGYPGFYYPRNSTASSDYYHLLGIDNDTMQFGLRASDGVAVFGAGNVWLDADGISFVSGSDAHNSIKWISAGGAVVGEMWTAGIPLSTSGYLYQWALGDNSMLVVGAGDLASTGMGVQIFMSPGGTPTQMTVHGIPGDSAKMDLGVSYTAAIGSVPVPNAGMGVGAYFQCQDSDAQDRRMGEQWYRQYGLEGSTVSTDYYSIVSFSAKKLSNPDGLAETFLELHGSENPHVMLHERLKLSTGYTPAAATDDFVPGAGQIEWDADYIYIHDGTEWKRAALSTF